MNTIAEVYNRYVESLKKMYGEREANNLTHRALEEVLNTTHWNRQDTIEKPKQQKLRNVLHRLLQGEPIQYVFNKAYFFDSSFFVNEEVLIPRPETEELVDWIIKDQKSSKKIEHMIDIGTGCGCIAIILKQHFSDATVVATDVSKQAIEVAQQNATKHEVNIQWKTEGLEAAIAAEDTNYEPFDIIVSNPPYVKKAEAEQLPDNVFNYEPHVALFVEEGDDLHFYRLLARFAKSNLKPAGAMYCELHEHMGEKVQQLFQQKGFNAQLRQDLSGKYRMIRVVKKPQ